MMIILGRPCCDLSFFAFILSISAPHSQSSLQPLPRIFVYKARLEEHQITLLVPLPPFQLIQLPARERDARQGAGVGWWSCEAVWCELRSGSRSWGWSTGRSGEAV
jgi:hypothetical protein